MSLKINFYFIFILFLLFSYLFFMYFIYNIIYDIILNNHSENDTEFLFYLYLFLIAYPFSLFLFMQNFLYLILFFEIISTINTIAATTSKIFIKPPPILNINPKTQKNTTTAPIKLNIPIIKHNLSYINLKLY